MTDCDGVLWRGTNAIGDAPKMIRAFREMGKKVIYVTNNSTKSRKEYVKKFEDLDFGGNFEDVFNPSYLAALYLKNLDFQKKVYVLGTKGITQELDDVGIRHIGVGPDPAPPEWNHEVAQSISAGLDPEVGCVIVSFDHHLSYIKLMKAVSYVEKPGVIFLGTNTDERFPLSETCIIPGSGSVLAAATTAACRDPLILGKPSTYMFEALMITHPEVKPSRTLMIGDKCSTDILLGKNCGLITLHVGSGMDSLADIRGWEKSEAESENKLVPDFHIPEVGHLLPFAETILAKKS